MSESFPTVFVGKLSHSLCRKGILFIILRLGGWGEIEIKAKLSPAEAGVWAELGKNLKVMQAEKDQKQKWRGTCRYCYKRFFDNQARDRHMENMHSDSIIEEEIETGKLQGKVEEGGDEVEDIRGTVFFTT